MIFLESEDDSESNDPQCSPVAKTAAIKNIQKALRVLDIL
jgi:hypothetical protein